MNDVLYAIESKIREQSQTRKTIDLGIIQAWVRQSANADQRRLADDWPDNKDLVAASQKRWEALMHLFDCYGGFQDRTWEQFTSLPKWYDIVQTLQAYDDQYGTKHYYGLLRVLEKFTYSAPKFYGRERFEPTLKELRYVKRVYHRYVKVLGLD